MYMSQHKRSLETLSERVQRVLKGEPSLERQQRDSSKQLPERVKEERISVNKQQTGHVSHPKPSPQRVSMYMSQHKRSLETLSERVQRVLKGEPSLERKQRDSSKQLPERVKEEHISVKKQQTDHVSHPKPSPQRVSKANPTPDTNQQIFKQCLERVSKEKTSPERLTQASKDKPSPERLTQVKPAPQWKQRITEEISKRVTQVKPAPQWKQRITEEISKRVSKVEPTQSCFPKIKKQKGPERSHHQTSRPKPSPEQFDHAKPIPLRRQPFPEKIPKT